MTTLNRQGETLLQRSFVLVFVLCCLLLIGNGPTPTLLGACFFFVSTICAVVAVGIHLRDLQADLQERTPL